MGTRATRCLTISGAQFSVTKTAIGVLMNSRSGPVVCLEPQGLDERASLVLAWAPENGMPTSGRLRPRPVGGCCVEAIRRRSLLGSVPLPEGQTKPVPQNLCNGSGRQQRLRHSTETGSREPVAATAGGHPFPTFKLTQHRAWRPCTSPPGFGVADERRAVETQTRAAEGSWHHARRQVAQGASFAWSRAPAAVAVAVRAVQRRRFESGQGSAEAALHLG